MKLFVIQAHANQPKIIQQEQHQQLVQQLLNRMETSKETFKQRLGKWIATVTAEDIQLDNGYQKLSKMKQKQGCDILQTSIDELDIIFSELKHFYAQYGIQRSDLPDRQEIISNSLQKLNNPNLELSRLGLRCNFQ